MQRLAIKQLIQWKASKRRKPLLLTGARQVGKTWLVKEFGEQEYEQVAYISFLENARMKELFQTTISPQRLIPALSIEAGTPISPDNTLIIFDEVQECPLALTSLKNFCEEAPAYHIVATGSNLGISLHPETSFPVGKINMMTLHPLSYEEFLLALGEDALTELLRSGDWEMTTPFHDRLMEYLRYYLYVGGMPEVVDEFAATWPGADFDLAREIQHEIILGYRNDFSKHADEASSTLKVARVWDSIPGQLARENKKFIYGAIRKGARGREYETAVQWLIDAGLVLKINRARELKKPLTSYLDPDAFKLYLVDVGLLGALSGLEARTLLEGDTLFTEFKGALAEQFVCQEITCARDAVPFYWSAENSSGEIDFAYQSAIQGDIVPVEVKAGVNLQAKSLKSVINRYGTTRALRFSALPYKDNGTIQDMPLYAAGFVTRDV